MGEMLLDELRDAELELFVGLPSRPEPTLLVFAEVEHLAALLAEDVAIVCHADNSFPLGPHVLAGTTSS